MNRKKQRTMRCRIVPVKRGFECVPLEFCCAGMRKAWADDWVGYGPYEELCQEKETRLSIYQCRRYVCRNVVWVKMAISHCPFCGAGILLREPAGPDCGQDATYCEHYVDGCEWCERGGAP